MHDSYGSPAAQAPRNYILIALLWALFVAYGSLVPLDFRPRPDAWQAFMNTPWLSLGVGSRADWVANVLLYLVLAWFASGAVWTSRLSVWVRTPLLACVLGAILALAVGIEYLQLFFPPRTVSRNDLLAEALGTGLGMILWFAAGPRLAAMWRRFVDGGTHSLRAVLGLYALGYLALALFPYDFLVSRAELAAKLARPDSLGLLPGLSCGPALTCGMKLLAEAALMIPFGILLVVGLRDRATRPAPGMARGLAAGALAGIVIEAVQVVLASGTTQGISVLTRALGTVWGLLLARGGVRGWLEYSPQRLLRAALWLSPVWLAILLATNGLLPLRLTRALGTVWGLLLARGGVRGWLEYSPQRLLRAALWLSPVWLAILLATNGLLPLRLQAPWAAAEKLETLRFLPFYYHYYSTETAAVRSLLFVAGSFAPVGVIAALAFPRHRFGAGLLALLVAALVAAAVELLKLFTEGKHPDPT
ncbi:MAG TPA: VanZ family protein, partial [Thauera aminoaromatica]|nr:VanZ family protein [Thauera aminoaromatica]